MIKPSCSIPSSNMDCHVEYLPTIRTHSKDTGEQSHITCLLCTNSVADQVMV